MRSPTTTGELAGLEIRHYPDNDTLEIDQVRLHSYNKDGQLTVITANKALSNGDGSEVQFFGNAHVVREAKQVTVKLSDRRDDGRRSARPAARADIS